MYRGKMKGDRQRRHRVGGTDEETPKGRKI
jgi:hypothetical protein